MRAEAVASSQTSVMNIDDKLALAHSLHDQSCFHLDVSSTFLRKPKTRYCFILNIHKAEDERKLYPFFDFVRK